jgi:hypothetical protein
LGVLGHPFFFGRLSKGVDIFAKFDQNFGNVKKLCGTKMGFLKICPFQNFDFIGIFLWFALFLTQQFYVKACTNHFFQPPKKTENLKNGESSL